MFIYFICYITHEMDTWTKEQKNWSKADSEFIKNALTEKPIPTSYKEILDEYEKNIPSGC